MNCFSLKTSVPNCHGLLYIVPVLGNKVSVHKRNENNISDSFEHWLVHCTRTENKVYETKRCEIDWNLLKINYNLSFLYCAGCPTACTENFKNLHCKYHLDKLTNASNKNRQVSQSRILPALSCLK
jgi:hypothetical protein